jgi:hypothetical protein
MNIPFRPLGKVMELASSTGLEVTYAFDDLVFSEHSLFIIRFDKKNETLIHVYFNRDCEENTAKEIWQTLFNGALKQKLKINNSGKFQITPKIESEEMDIEFFEITNT